MIGFVLTVVLLVIVIHLCFVRSVVCRNGKAIRVRKREGSEEVAERLYKLQSVLLEFCKNTRDPLTYKIYRRWDGVLSENSTLMSWEAAYTSNKTSVSICVRDGQGRLVDWNTSVFVALHELAHVGTDEHNHTPLFWQNNQKLLLLAIQAGILQYVPYAKEPTTFCGHKIAHNPVSCVYQGSCASPWTGVRKQDEHVRIVGGVPFYDIA